MSREYKAAKNCGQQILQAGYSILQKNLAYEECSPRRIFSYVKWLNPVSVRIVAVKNSAGLVKTEPGKIAIILNEQYRSEFIKDQEDSPPPFSKTRVY